MVLEFLGSQTLLDVHKTIVELSEDELWKGDDNGFFFIEGTFYTNGSTDYVTPIKQWLASGTKESQSSRAEFLGLTSFDSLESVHMDKVRLDSISFRLGFRCVHVHHGDVECSIFATDRRLINPPPSVSFPIIHDVWAQPASQPDCEACTHAPATLATSTTCEITNGHTMLCHSCARQLQIPPEQLEKFAVWRFQPNLSTGASSNHTF